MDKADKNRIIAFLLGNENTTEFEQWLYNDPELESRIGSKFYFDLIDFNYQKNDIIHELKKVVLDKYISLEDFKSFKYFLILKNAGWFQGRKIKVKSSKIIKTFELENAIKIIEEFGGLKFDSPDRRDNWSLTLVEFLDSPGVIQNMKDYGLDKNLVCFATAHNDHIDLFVDENNKYYQLDNVVSENLYVYRGLKFEHMMRELLMLEKDDNFHKMENPQIEKLRYKRKKRWERIMKNNRKQCIFSYLFKR